MKNLNLLFCLLVLFILGTGATVFSQNQPSPQMAAANELYKAQKWSEAAAAYENITKSEPNNPNAWYQLAMANYSLKRYGPAAEAFQKNIAISNSGFAMYNLASVYSLVGEKEKSIEWLTKTVDNPKTPLPILNFDDPDFANVKDDARFKALFEKVDRQIYPCKYSEESKQFNFFIGEWDAYNPQGNKTGSSVIQSISNGCGILENWSNAFGAGGGKSINFYDAATKKWYQYWIGQNGTPGRLSGVYKDGALRYEAELSTVNGKTVLRRLTFFNLDANTVRQLGENSTDEGKTWSTTFDFKYVRKDSK